MVGYYSRGRGIEPGRDRLFFEKKIFRFFFKKIFFPVFLNGFVFIKKVSLTTLVPSGMPGGATHGPSQAPYGLQNCQNGQKWSKMAQNHQKMIFFDFQSVYTQNDRNFALILNFSLIFEGKNAKIDKNGQKWPKMAQNHQKVIF